MGLLDNVRRFLVRAQTVAHHQGVLDSAISMSMINGVEGDYLEFGVFRGERLLQAYETATFLTKWIRSGKDPSMKKVSTSTLESMRFIGFDSFEGLPKASAIDVAQGQEEWIGEGGFAASLEEVTAAMPKKAIGEGRIKLVKGWFDKTLTPDTKRALEIKAASVVYVDCDYYESTVPAQENVNYLIDNA
jgi:hypothetical protein